MVAVAVGVAVAVRVVRQIAVGVVVDAFAGRNLKLVWIVCQIVAGVVVGLAAIMVGAWIVVANKVALTKDESNAGASLHRTMV